jgi:hypothetical protein
MTKTHSARFGQAALALLGFAFTACGGGADSQAPASTTAQPAVTDPAPVAAAPAPAPDAVAARSYSIQIASEGEPFTLRTPQTVRYGAGSSWIEKALMGAGLCTNEFFGTDPAVGIGKRCELSAAVVPAAGLTFKNLMVIHRHAERSGQRWVYSDAAIAATRDAFLNTWPALVKELTAGAVVMDNTVVVTDTPITGWTDDRPRNDGVGDWQTHVGATGNFDVMYIANPAPQGAMWAQGGGVCCDNTLKVGWVFVGLRDDLGLHDDALAGWTHEWLHVMGEGFYKDRMQLPGIPAVHGGEALGYLATTGGYAHWQGWYADYLMRRVDDHGVRSGLGSRAWGRGTLRDYLAKGGR